MKKYGEISPIQSPIAAERQSAKRHYGVHPYFTRRPHNVVRKYILHYSKEGDRVLDPFGGSGITAIEAFLENRVGIQNDINPLANFIAKGIADLVKGEIAEYEAGLRTLREACKRDLEELGRLPVEQLEDFTRRLELPRNVTLPKSSDVEHYHDLFSPRQIASLAIIRKAIDSIRQPYARKGMLLAWSATLAKLNRTFLSADGRSESRGGSSIFSIYRYKVAKQPVELPPWKTFEERASNVIAAKVEMERIIELKRRTAGWQGKFEVHQSDVDELSEKFTSKIDYIFTDPPYGAHISYLDLSTLWNCWLGTMPSMKARRKELIVGGELEIEEKTYTDRLGRSVEDCINMLKPDRWLSVVFQHWNTDYFDAILSSAAENGADLRAAVPQAGDTIWSMHKKKGNESVLAGELILTFYKTGKPLVRATESKNFDVDLAISQILAGSPTPVLYGENVFNQLILAAWRKGSIGSLKITKDEFNELLVRRGWRYDEENHYWVKELLERTLFGVSA